MYRFQKIIFAYMMLLWLALLGGCLSESSEQQRSSLKYANNIERLYTRSCIACHASGAASAPITQDRDAWRSRIASKGIEGLVNSTVKGIGSMPPRGLCADCSEDDFRQLIYFMVGDEAL